MSTFASNSAEQVNEQSSGNYEQGSTKIANARRNNEGQQQDEGEMMTQAAEYIRSWSEVAIPMSNLMRQSKMTASINAKRMMLTAILQIYLFSSSLVL